MQIKLVDLLDATDRETGVLTAPVPYKGTDCRIILRHCSAEEGRRHYSKHSKGDSTPSTAVNKRFWLSHVVGWENLEDSDGSLIGYTARRAQRLFELDQDFADFVVRESKNLDNFRGDAAAEAAPDAVEAGA